MIVTPSTESKPDLNLNGLLPMTIEESFVPSIPSNKRNDPQSFAPSLWMPLTSICVGCFTRSNMCSTISWGVVTCQLARVLLLPWPTAVVNIASCWIFRSTGWASLLSMSVTDSGASNRRREALSSRCCDCCCPDWLNRRSARNMSSSVFKMMMS